MWNLSRISIHDRSIDHMKKLFIVIVIPPLLSHVRNQKVRFFCMNGFLVSVFLANSPVSKISAPIRRSIERSMIASSVMISNMLYPRDRQISNSGWYDLKNVSEL